VNLHHCTPQYVQISSQLSSLFFPPRGHGYILRCFFAELPHNGTLPIDAQQRRSPTFQVLSVFFEVHIHYFFHPIRVHQLTLYIVPVIIVVP
jgi:hypothetical protein